MQPDLELVAVRRDESFKAWYHGYPYRTVRWHFHPEYEIHLIVATTGKMFVGDHISSFAPGNLVLLGPNLPHNWVSDVPEGETVEQRNLVLQFGQEFVAHCMESFPEWRQVEGLLTASRRGVLFGAQTSAARLPCATRSTGADTTPDARGETILRQCARSRWRPRRRSGRCSCASPKGVLRTVWACVF